MLEDTGMKPHKNEIYTEGYIVQFLDDRHCFAKRDDA